MSERYGGEFWRSHNASARRGFVEGYTDCRASFPSGPKWTRPVDYYMALLNDLYNAEDVHGEDGREYTGSVVSALDKYKDQR